MFFPNDDFERLELEKFGDEQFEYLPQHITIDAVLNEIGGFGKLQWLALLTCMIIRNMGQA